MPLFLKEKRKPLLLMVLVFFHLILISLQVPLGEKQTVFEKVIFSIFSPLQHGITGFFRGIGNVWTNHIYLHNVQSQNQKLYRELFSLRQENAWLRNALRKLSEVKEIQQNLSKISPTFLVASVIGVDPNNIYKSIIIGKGFAGGIKKNMVVLDKYGNLVGRVISPIASNEARVQLITDTDSGVSALIPGEKAIGVLSGDGQGECSLKYVLTSEPDISEGEEILTSGFDGIYPSGLRIGKIFSVAKNVSLFKKIKAKPYFEFNELTQVAILPLEIKENSKETFR